MPSWRARRKNSFQRRKAANRPQRDAPVVPLLLENAPIGTYHIDRIADELLALGATPKDRIEFIEIIRTGIYLAAGMAVMAHERYYVGQPRRFSKVKRLFADIALIAKLIERNKNLERVDLLLTTKRIGVKTSRDEIDELLADLTTAAEAIKRFQNSRALERRGGNHDPLTDDFIQNVYDLWCDHLRIDRTDEENKLFLRFVSAAWRDVQFPNKDRKGQLLEDWLTDRVRKKFRRGVCESRIDSQGLYGADREQGAYSDSSY